MKRMDRPQYGRMDDTKYKTGTYTYYSVLLSLTGIDPNQINAITSEIPPSSLLT